MKTQIELDIVPCRMEAIRWNAADST